MVSDPSYLYLVFQCLCVCVFATIFCGNGSGEGVGGLGAYVRGKLGHVERKLNALFPLFSFSLALECKSNF